MRRIPIVLVLLVSVSLTAQQRLCDDTHKISQCTNSIVPSTLLPISEQKEAKKKAEATEVATAATGVPTIDSFLGNSTRDFLSLFAAGLQTANLSEEQDALTLDWNFRFNEYQDPVKLQAVLRKPVLFKEFANQLSADVNRAKLEDEFEDFDDVTLSATYEPENRTLGRNLTPHAELYESIHGDLDSTAPSALELRLGARLREIPALNGIEDPTFEQIPATDREEIRRLAIASGEEIVANRAAFDQAFAARGINRFSDLLNNQPQLYVSVNRRERSSLVGPHETSIKAT